MSTERADFQRAVVLLGWDGADLVPVLVDSSGQLYMVAKGEKAGGGLEILAVDDDGQLVTVLRGQSGNYVNVDGSGFMTAVIKADYAGSPVTVGADSEGRLKMFLVDDIDAWGQWLEVGNAEQAARQRGPIASYDRRGHWAFSQDFEHGAGIWDLATSGGSAALHTTEWIQGGQCIRLLANAHDPVYYASMAITVGRPPSAEGLGLSFWVRFPQLPSYWRLRMKYMNSPDYYDAYIKGLLSDGKLYVYGPGPAETEVGTWDIGAAADSVWHYFKLTFDPEEEKYIRFLMDGETIDLSARSVYKSASAFEYVELDFTIFGGTAAAGEALVDLPVFTMMET